MLWLSTTHGASSNWNPGAKQSHRQLMRVLARSGQRSAALVQYATCRRVLAEELGVEPEEETTTLYEQIQRGAAPADAHPTLSPTNLAAHTPLTPLIGRETELAQLADRLEERDCRLLTLVGPGGIGKTRLALQAAADLGASFRDGVALSHWPRSARPSSLVPAIASALGLTFTGPADPKAQLLAFLRAKDMLLVLDNFEHLLAAAPLVSELLAACPDLTVLVTSRAPLHVRGEQQFPVPPLLLPNLAHLPDVGTLTQYSAVALFVARAAGGAARLSADGGERSRPSRRSACGWTGCHWRSSWRRRGSSSCRPKPCWRGWSSGWPC